METPFKVGDKVNVYSLMNPRRDFKAVATISDIGPMHGGTEDMLWLGSGEGGARIRGAWHPDSCELSEGTVHHSLSKAIEVLNNIAFGGPGIGTINEDELYDEVVRLKEEAARVLKELGVI